MTLPRNADIIALTANGKGQKMTLQEITEKEGLDQANRVLWAELNQEEYDREGK